MSVSRKSAVWLGLLGVLGGMVLFAGDMLFYFLPGSTDISLNMAQAAGWRIRLSAVTALFATFLYILGIGQIYYAFEKTTPAARTATVLLFLYIFIGYGIVHAQYTAIAISARIAQSNGLDLPATVAFARSINDTLRQLIYPAFAALSVLFIWQVWKRKTRYPRWMVLFYPLLPFIIQFPLCPALSGQAYLIICGGYLNLILILFFAASSFAIITENNNK